MDFASIQAQLANLTSQLSQIAESTTMQSVPTFGASYRQGYQANLYPQSDWSDHSNSMWWEAQQVQHKAYWQPYEEFYSRPMQPPQPHIQYAQSNLGSSIDYNQILNELNSLLQGSQNQAKEDQQGGYWQQEEEFYHWPYELSHPSQQFAQFNSGTSLDNDMFNKLLTSLYQEVENRNKEMPIQTKKTGELEKHIGQIMEFMAHIQEQSEVSNSTIENSKEDFEIHDAITLGRAMEVGADLKTSKHCLEVDEELLIEEEEEDIHTARVEQPLPQPPKPSNPPTTSKDVPISFHSNVIPPNVHFPSRFLIPKQEESEKDIVAALPKVQKDIPILGATKQALDRVEYFKGLCFPRRMIQEKVVAKECQDFIKEDKFETTKPKEVEFDDIGQVTTIIVNLAKSNIPETFKGVVFVIEFLSDKAKSKPMPVHFKYHRPFKDQIHAVGPRNCSNNQI
ncbi:hypothetical protein TB2_031904 [Malus domestica]